MTTILLVTPSRSTGEPIADALEARGCDVMWCRGPSGPTCTCAAIRLARCPLTTDVDGVIVDTSLLGDQLGRGLRSADMIRYYNAHGLPVLALGPQRNLDGDARPAVTLPRHSPPEAVVEVLDALVTARRRSSELTA